MDQFSGENLGVLGQDVDAAEFADSLVSENIDVPFTPAARRVLDRCADSLADGDAAVLTDHLLQAISDTPESAAAQLIDEHGDSGEELLTALQTMLGQDARDGDPVINPRLERVVIRAKREAFRRRHPEVSTLHLLMALLRERTVGFMR
jgi:ATP-dependent Clp protease ATP-binding subunit ClpA